MRKERKYLAKLDDGHDYAYWNYYSCHRAGSKANASDCFNDRTHHMSYREARRWKIVDVWLDESE